MVTYTEYRILPVEHLFPKAKYPEFSTFSLNLVPACSDCNTHKINEVVDAVSNGRILHPYYDEILKKRLVISAFSSLGEVPIITLSANLPITDNNYASVKFHIQNVLMKTSLSMFLEKKWSKLYNHPSMALSEWDEYKTGNKSLKEAIIKQLSFYDGEHESLNNWHSVFMSGLLDESVLNWLDGHFNP